MALVRNAKQFGCVVHDSDPPKVRLILRKGTNSLRPKWRVQFAPDALQSAKTREREPSLGVVQTTHPHERSFFAPKFENRTQEDTLTKKAMGSR